jgi:hypothetical protein
MIGTRWGESDQVAADKMSAIHNVRRGGWSPALHLACIARMRLLIAEGVKWLDRDRPAGGEVDRQ